MYDYRNFGSFMPQVLAVLQHWNTDKFSSMPTDRQPRHANMAIASLTFAKDACKTMTITGRCSKQETEQIDRTISRIDDTIAYYKAHIGNKR